MGRDMPPSVSSNFPTYSNYTASRINSESRQKKWNKDRIDQVDKECAD